jgi:ABC-2 type transport system ATP-binding protein
MIEISHLTRRFGRTTAVDRLDLAVGKGEIFGFLGPNGAGKTTTIRMMVGLLRPSEGTVLFNNGSGVFDIRTDGLAARKRIGYIPDAPFLYEKLTGREHLRFIGEIYEVPRKQLEEEIEQYLALFSLQKVADQPIEGYSHGMRQKIVMSGALLHHPDFLIVDEPMVGLDPRSARIVKDLFLNLSREKDATLFISTHSLDLAEEICDRIGIISASRLIALGTKEELNGKIERKDSRLEEIFLELTSEEEDQPGEPHP